MSSNTSSSSSFGQSAMLRPSLSFVSKRDAHPGALPIPPMLPGNTTTIATALPSPCDMEDICLENNHHHHQQQQQQQLPTRKRKFDLLPTPPNATTTSTKTISSYRISTKHASNAAAAVPYPSPASPSTSFSAHEASSSASPLPIPSSHAQCASSSSSQAAGVAPATTNVAAGSSSSASAASASQNSNPAFFDPHALVLKIFDVRPSSFNDYRPMVVSPDSKLRAILDMPSRIIPANLAQVQNMRSEMVQWMIKINREHSHLRYCPETIFLAVNYCNRYLSQEVLQSPAHYYLLGMVAISVAAKIVEEFNEPLSEFMIKLLRPKGFDLKAIKRMEVQLTNVLQFELYDVTPTQILYEIYRQMPIQAQIQTLLAPSSSSAMPSISPASFLTSLQHRIPLQISSNGQRGESWQGFDAISRTTVRILSTLAEDIIMKSLTKEISFNYDPTIITIAALNLALELHSNTLLAHQPHFYSHLSAFRLRLLCFSNQKQASLNQCLVELRSLII